MLRTEGQALASCCPIYKATCRGPECMAWRWVGAWRRGHRAHDMNFAGPADTPEPPRPSDLPEDWEWHVDTEDFWAGWREPEAAARRRRPGYCGLAGKP